MSHERQQLRQIARCILDPARPLYSFYHEMQALKDILEVLTPFRRFYKQDISRGETRTPSGLAISPTQAAMCLDEIARSCAFIRGLNAAIRDRIDRNGGKRPIHVLYAGCGPYAVLALPVMSLYPATQVQFTLIDLHQVSLASARTLVENLGYARHVTAYHRTDAACYSIEAGETPDIIVSETMNQCLDEEPQVSILRNLSCQAPNARLIPRSVRISACLADSTGPPAPSGPQPGPDNPPTGRDRIPLGGVFELNRQNIMTWRHNHEDHLPAAGVRLPPSFHHCYRLTLLTNITVYEGIELGEGDCSLTLPQKPSLEQSLRGGEELQFRYRLGSRPGLACRMIRKAEGPAFKRAASGRMIRFLRTIGLEIHTRPLAGQTLLPGIKIERGTLVVDEARLAFPGDLLHEAGHLAVCKPERRKTMSGDALGSGGEEMAAIAWSYAAALHLGIDPSIVFHEQGYRGWSQSILENFAVGRYFGVPMLAWLGLALDPQRPAGGETPAYPHMIKWLVD